jgi:EmrB/QacA subfamily drug resistance transporter
MTTGTTPTPRSKALVLTAMIFAVAMTFIDQTIVSISAPRIQHELNFSSSGILWAINAYLLTLAAFFAFAGRLADTVGHRKMVVLGVLVFASSSAMCGLTPKGHLAEAWIVTFRALQGVGGAIMFPAALAIVVQTFEFHQRGRALALFFGIAGGLTAVGPVAGGYLTEWTWRAIFWINVPVALISLVLIFISKPVTAHRPAPVSLLSLGLIASGVGLSVFGFEQSSLWGWASPVIWVSIVSGLLLLVVFFAHERRADSPLIRVHIFANRTFSVENLILGIAMVAFIPVFFFASEYAQVSLGEPTLKASLVLLYFFIGFVVAAQIGGRMLDRRGAKRPVVLGSVLAAVGFGLWASKMTDLHLSSQVWFIVLAGAGMGLMLGQANTDAVNRASRFTYGEATGITQTVRNYAASLGIAILGTITVSVFRSRITNSLISRGVPTPRAVSEARELSQSQGGHGSISSIPHFIKLDFAYASRTVFFVMAGVMAVAALVARVGLEAGVQETEQVTEPVASDLLWEGVPTE